MTNLTAQLEDERVIMPQASTYVRIPDDAAFRGETGPLPAGVRRVTPDALGAIRLMDGPIARNAEGKVILYADRMTGSMQAALEETQRRREKQLKFNAEHGITPKTIKKTISSALSDMTEADYVKDDNLNSKEIADLKNIDKKLREYTKKMKEAAANLEFEEAVIYRDKIKELEQLAMKNT